MVLVAYDLPVRDHPNYKKLTQFLAEKGGVEITHLVGSYPTRITESSLLQFGPILGKVDLPFLFLKWM